MSWRTIKFYSGKKKIKSDAKNKNIIFLVSSVLLIGWALFRLKYLCKDTYILGGVISYTVRIPRRTLKLYYSRKKIKFRAKKIFSFFLFKRFCWEDGRFSDWVIYVKTHLYCEVQYHVQYEFHEQQKNYITAVKKGSLETKQFFLCWYVCSRFLFSLIFDYI